MSNRKKQNFSQCYCTNCGAPAYYDSFCSQCGAPTSPAPKKESGNGGLIALFSVLGVIIVGLIAAIVIVLFRSADSGDDIEQHFAPVYSVVVQYSDPNGYVDPSDVSAAIDAVVAEGQNISGLTEIIKNDNSVVFRAESGPCRVYAPEEQGLDDAGDTFRVAGLDAASFENYTGDIFTGSDTLELTSQASAYGSCVIDPDLDDIFEALSQPVVVWSGNSVFVNGFGYILRTDIPFTDDLADDYGLSDNEYVLLIGRDGCSLGLTSVFFVNHLADVSCDHSLFFFATGCPETNTFFMEDILSAGAESVIIGNESMSCDYRLDMIRFIVTAYLCGPDHPQVSQAVSGTAYGWTDRDHWTLDDAVAVAMLKYGITDPVTAAQFVIYGSDPQTLVCTEWLSRLSGSVRGAAATTPVQATPTPAPIQATPAPVQATTAPVQATTAPVQATTAPAAESAAVSGLPADYTVFVTEVSMDTLGSYPTLDLRDQDGVYEHLYNIGISSASGDRTDFSVLMSFEADSYNMEIYQTCNRLDDDYVINWEVWESYRAIIYRPASQSYTLLPDDFYWCIRGDYLVGASFMSEPGAPVDTSIRRMDGTLIAELGRVQWGVYLNGYWYYADFSEYWNNDWNNDQPDYDYVIYRFDFSTGRSEYVTTFNIADSVMFDCYTYLTADGLTFGNWYNDETVCYGWEGVPIISVID